MLSITTLSLLATRFIRRWKTPSVIRSQPQLFGQNRIPMAGKPKSLGEAARVLVAMCVTGASTLAYGQFSPASLNFGAVNMGTTSASQTITYAFNSAVSLNSISVLTQGLSGRDFKDAGTGSCKANYNYSVATTCTVAVSYSPAVAGTRYGAVVLMDSSGTTIATAFLQGTGAGPEAIFIPGTANFVPTSAAVLYDIAVDPAGNLYVADLGNGRILKETVSLYKMYRAMYSPYAKHTKRELYSGHI